MRNRPKSFARLLALCAVGAGAGSCQERGSSRPLTSESFYRTQTPSADTATHPLDQPGAVRYDEETRPNAGDDDSGRAADPASGGEVPSVVTDNVVPSVATLTTAPADQPTTGPATRAVEVRPATRPLAVGGFQIVGFVVAEVNGHPVFADEVIKQLDSALAAEAKKYDREAFKGVASKLIVRQVDLLVMDELEVAAAESQLNADEKRLADSITTQWRGEEITKAGGSVQRARENYKAQGLDFDEQVRKRYRLHLVQVFSRKKIVPLISVSADDVREYYRKDVAEFTQYGQATFRLIKIDPKKQGGRDAAERRAHAVRARATAEDFAALAASDVNDDATARAAGGLLQPLLKGSYVLEKVEEAVWKAGPGEVTDVVADSGAFYVAKVESLKEGSVQSFGDLAVQEKIRNTLRGQQFQKLREEMRRKLIADAVVKGRTDAQLQVTIDMAMQSYDQWAAAE